MFAPRLLTSARRTCGLHVFVFYIIVLTAMLAMSTACLSASDSGYFVFEQKVDRTDDDGVSYNVDYKVKGQKAFRSFACNGYPGSQGLDRYPEEVRASTFTLVGRDCCG